MDVGVAVPDGGAPRVSVAVGVGRRMIEYVIGPTVFEGGVVAGLSGASTMRVNSVPSHASGSISAGVGTMLAIGRTSPRPAAPNFSSASLPLGSPR